MDWLIKLLFILMLAPFILGIGLQIIGGFMAAILPWLILCSVIAGVVGGASAACMIRRRLPSSKSTSLPLGAPPLGPYRTRRPRGGRSSRKP